MSVCFNLAGVGASLSWYVHIDDGETFVLIEVEAINGGAVTDGFGRGESLSSYITDRVAKTIMTTFLKWDKDDPVVVYDTICLVVNFDFLEAADVNPVPPQVICELNMLQR